MGRARRFAREFSHAVADSNTFWGIVSASYPRHNHRGKTVMPCFQRNSGPCVIDPITLVEGNELKLKLKGEVAKGRATHYTLNNGAAAFLRIEAKSDPMQEYQTINITALSRTPVVRIRALSPETKALPNVPPVMIEVVPQISLPPDDTDAGLIVRLLLAEALTPTKSGYGDGEEARQSMDMMRQVLDNRLHASPTKLGPRINAVPIGSNLKDIIFAGGQFEGFVGERIVGSARKTIDGFIRIMNNGTYENFKKVRRHVEYALEVAQRPASATPITKNSLTHWRTAGSDAPSSNVELFRKIAGQAFYTLKQDYLDKNAK
jgi:hypothetical protein